MDIPKGLTREHMEATSPDVMAELLFRHGTNAMMAYCIRQGLDIDAARILTAACMRRCADVLQEHMQDG